MEYTLQSLPESIQEIVFDEKNVDINHSIAVVNKIRPEDFLKIQELVVRVITKHLPVTKLATEIKKLKIEGLDEKKVALDFTLLRFWPLRRWLSDVEIAIKKFGGPKTL